MSVQERLPPLHSRRIPWLCLDTLPFVSLSCTTPPTTHSRLDTLAFKRPTANCIAVVCWPHIAKDQQCVATCEKYQRNKGDPGPLRPLPNPSQPWEVVVKAVVDTMEPDPARHCCCQSHCRCLCSRRHFFSFCFSRLLLRQAWHLPNRSNETSRSVWPEAKWCMRLASPSFLNLAVSFLPSLASLFRLLQCPRETAAVEATKKNRVAIYPHILKDLSLAFSRGRSGPRCTNRGDFLCILEEYPSLRDAHASPATSQMIWSSNSDAGGRTDTVR